MNSLTLPAMPSMPSLRRTDSGASTGSRLYIARPNAKRNRRPIGRSVSFGERRTRTVEIIDPEARNEVWYTKQELFRLHRKEIKKNLIVQLNVMEGKSNVTMESKGLTWRGLEDIEKENERSSKIQQYVQTVVYEHKQEADPNELKRLAKSLSKEAREEARQMAVMDELTVHGKKKDYAGLNRRKVALGRSLSGSLNWMKKQGASKKESAQAA